MQCHRWQEDENSNRKRGEHFLAVELAAPQSSIGLAGLCTMAKSGERLCFGGIFVFRAGDRRLRPAAVPFSAELSR